MAPRYNEPRHNEDPVIKNNIWKPDRIYAETNPAITNPAITNWFWPAQCTIYPAITNILSCRIQMVDKPNTTPERTILGRFSQVTINPNIIPMFSSSRILQLPLRLWWTPLIFPCSLSTYSGYPYVPHLPNLPVHCRQLHLAISLTFDVRCCSWGSYKRSLHSNTPASHLFQIPLKIRLLIFIISLVYFYLYTVLPNAEVP